MKGEFDKMGIGLVAISADSSEDSAEFAKDDEITLPLLADPELKVISAYGVAMEGNDIAVPATFVIRQDHTIASSYIGENMTDRPDAAHTLEIANKAR
jgi:peroxiredoxin